MPLGTFIAGAYTGTLNAVALGITDEGFNVQWEPKVQAIEKSDVYGEMLIDGVYRGTNHFIQTEFLEYKAGSMAAAYPYGSMGVQGVVGRLMSNIATALVLTSTAATPAVATPATLTASKAILAPGSNPQAQYNSRLRTLPVRMALLPDDVGGGVIKSYVTT
jgi:hypothetical protein